MMHKHSFSLLQLRAGSTLQDVGGTIAALRSIAHNTLTGITSNIAAAPSDVNASAAAGSFNLQQQKSEVLRVSCSEPTVQVMGSQEAHACSAQRRHDSMQACSSYQPISHHGWHSRSSSRTSPQSVPFLLQQQRAYHSWYYLSRQRDHQIMHLQTVEEVDEFMVKEYKHLSAINVAYLTSKLAAIVADSSSAEASDPDYKAKVVDISKYLMKRMDKVTKWYDPRYAGVAITALGRLGITNQGLIDSLLKVVIPRMADEAYSRDISRLAQGLLLHSYAGPQEWWASALPLLASKLASGKVPPENLTKALSAAAQLGVALPPELVAAAVQDARQRLVEYTPASLSALLSVLHKQKGSLPDELRVPKLVAKFSKHVAKNLEVAQPAVLIEFSHLALSLLPASSREPWGQANGELLQAMKHGMMAEGLGSIDPARLVRAAAVFAKAGQQPGRDFLVMHAKACSEALPQLSDSSRQLLAHAYNRIPGAMEVADAPLRAALGGQSAPAPGAGAAAAAAAPAAPAAEVAAPAGKQ